MIAQTESQPSVTNPRVKSLVVFSDDWGRHPSSCQHLIRRLLADYTVLWVNTIGTRAPSLNLATLRRGAGKLREWSSPAKGPAEEADEPRPTVLAPMMWPWFRRGADRWINRRLLTRSINKSLRGLPRPRVAVTTLPIVADLLDTLDVDAWLYYCVDDLAAWPGLDGDALRRMEELLVAKADRVVAVSDELTHRFKAAGRESTLITHGVELDHWSEERQPSQQLELIDEPRIVFWGLIDERLESSWVLALANRLEQGAIVLVGPVESLEEELLAHPRIRVVGAVEYAKLPEVAAAAAVLVMPYRDIPATRAMQPLKLKEYLATGLPCVARRLPATKPWSDCLDLAASVEEFVDLVVARLEGGLPVDQAVARERIVEESWDAKAAAFRVEVERTAEQVA